jgi:hypothetical protein
MRRTGVIRAPGRRTSLLSLVLAALAAIALAQPSVSVQIMTDATVPVDFGTNYPLGQLDNLSYAYGANFIIQVSYSGLDGSSLSLALSGSQPNYQLAWRVAGTSENNAFGVALGADVSGLSGSASDQYYRNDGTLRLLSTEATRYRIGARSTPAASEDLLVQVTLTATLY